MARSKPVPMLVTYRPKKGKEKRLLALIRKHEPALRKAGLASRAPFRVWKASDKWTGEVYFVEMFEWKDETSSAAAHRSPEVRAVWGPMEEVLADLQLARIEPVSDGR